MTIFEGSPSLCSVRKLQEDLERLFSPCGFGNLPTPLQHLPRIGGLLDHRHIYIKRDDLTGLGLGGNKVRNLRFFFSEAISHNADTVITSGGLQSNLCTLTAAASAKMGLRCILVHNDDPPKLSTGNQLLSRLLGAEMQFLGKVDENARSTAARTIAREEQENGFRPYIIENGGSIPLGCLGYLESALELFTQTRKQNLDLGHVVIVGAMGGTAAGFIVGNMLMGNPFQVHIISVEYGRNRLECILNDLIKGTLSLLEDRHFPLDVDSDPAFCSEIAPYTVYHQYLGGGYSIPTEASEEAALTMARTEGIFLETVYNSKTFAGAVDLISRGVIPRDQGVCIFHTGGVGALFGGAAPLHNIL